jgi:hypothetical protein
MLSNIGMSESGVAESKRALGRRVLKALHEGDALTFRWPDSPMRILVEVDPTAAEGPLAIELASGRGLAGLNEASARLGIRLAQRPGI